MIKSLLYFITMTLGEVVVLVLELSARDRAINNFGMLSANR